MIDWRLSFRPLRLASVRETWSNTPHATRRTAGGHRLRVLATRYPLLQFGKLLARMCGGQDSRSVCPVWRVQAVRLHSPRSLSCLFELPAAANCPALHSSERLPRQPLEQCWNCLQTASRTLGSCTGRAGRPQANGAFRFAVARRQAHCQRDGKVYLCTREGLVERTGASRHGASGSGPQRWLAATQPACRLHGDSLRHFDQRSWQCAQHAQPGAAFTLSRRGRGGRHERSMACQAMRSALGLS